MEQALLVAERGVDVIIAQGTEAVRFGGKVSTVVLVPQVVDAVGPVQQLASTKKRVFVEIILTSITGRRIHRGPENDELAPGDLY